MYMHASEWFLWNHIICGNVLVCTAGAQFKYILNKLWNTVSLCIIELYY